MRCCTHLAGWKTGVLAGVLLGLTILMLVSSGCGGGASSSPGGPSPFAGNYSGTYAGDQSGTWTATVAANGDVTVSIRLGEEIFQGTGTVARSGDAHLVTSGTGTAGYFRVVWDGDFTVVGDSITGAGTWADNWGQTCTWEGHRI